MISPLSFPFFSFERKQPRSSKEATSILVYRRSSARSIGLIVFHLRVTKSLNCVRVDDRILPSICESTTTSRCSNMFPTDTRPGGQALEARRWLFLLLDLGNRSVKTSRKTLIHLPVSLFIWNKREFNSRGECWRRGDAFVVRQCPRLKGGNLRKAPPKRSFLCGRNNSSLGQCGRARRRCLTSLG